MVLYVYDQGSKVSTILVSYIMLTIMLTMAVTASASSIVTANYRTSNIEHFRTSLYRDPTNGCGAAVLVGELPKDWLLDPAFSKRLARRMSLG